MLQHQWRRLIEIQETMMEFIAQATADRGERK